MRALIIKIGFWGPIYTIFAIRNPQNGIGNFQGPYISCVESSLDLTFKQPAMTLQTIPMVPATGW